MRPRRINIQGGYTGGYRRIHATGAWAGSVGCAYVTPHWRDMASGEEGSLRSGCGDVGGHTHLKLPLRPMMDIIHVDSCCAMMQSHIFDQQGRRGRAPGGRGGSGRPLPQGGGLG